jgi:hypothetical protein
MAKSRQRKAGSEPSGPLGATVCAGTGLAFPSRRMLRITVTTLPELTTVILEGRLTGPWVPELATCWRKLVATRDARSILINLDGVTFVDAAGKALIRTIRRRGASLAATELMTRTIIDREDDA